MSDELKPCPFCGSQPTLDAPVIRSGEAWAYIRCDSYCGVKPMASGCVSTHYYDRDLGRCIKYKSEAEAKEFALTLAKDRWNGRKGGQS